VIKEFNFYQKFNEPIPLFIFKGPTINNPF